MSQIDTSIYNNIQNPLTQVQNLQQMGLNQQQLQIRGAQLGAQQSIGNALMHNTGPDGTVNTDGMMAELAGSGNPYAQQQGAELAQHLSLQQSLNQQAQIETNQKTYAYMANKMAGLMQTGLSNDDLAGAHAEEYGQVLSGNSDLNPKIINPSAIVQNFNTMQALPQAQRKQYAQQKLAMWSAMAGPQADTYGVLPTVPAVGGSGQAGTVSPASLVGGDSGTQAGGTLPPVPAASAALPNNPVLNATIKKAAANPSGAVDDNTNVPPLPLNPSSFHATAPLPQQAANNQQMQTVIAGMNPTAQQAEQNYAALSEVKNLIKSSQGKTSTGPFQQSLVNLVHTNPALAAMVPDADTLSSAQLINKLLTQALPPGHSDADRSQISSGNPGLSMEPDALLKSINFVQGRNLQPIQLQKVLSKTLAQNGDASFVYNQFTSNQDPKVFQAMAMEPAEQKQFVQSLPPAERKTLWFKLNALQQLGAFQDGQ